MPIGYHDPFIERVEATRLTTQVLVMFQIMEQRSLFPDTRRDATDAEVVAALRVAIARGGRLPRLAELFLASIGAEYLVDELRGLASSLSDVTHRHPMATKATWHPSRGISC